MGDTEKKPRTSLELAEDRTRLAEIRNDYAESRTIQAAQRTYAAWTRTGFTLASTGWAFSRTLQEINPGAMPLLIGGILMALGVVSFIYGWYGFRAVYKFLQETTLMVDQKYPYRMDYVLVTIMTIVLVIVFILGFSILLT